MQVGGSDRASGGIHCQKCGLAETRTNVVFGDGASWITPETFLLPGTKRAFLLSRGDIRECSVRAEDIGKFRFCSLINAMLDPGDVVVRTEDIILR